MTLQVVDYGFDEEDTLDFCPGTCGRVALLRKDFVSLGLYDQEADHMCAQDTPPTMEALLESSVQKQGKA